ncbi:MAG: MFS transporter [Chloroflexi bacterium]|nr:MFS transporter [Chloroflexota bacterium]
MSTPIANSRARWTRFTKPRAILAMVSLAHAVNHAYATLMPLIYPAIVTEFKLSYTDLGVMVGAANAVSGLMQMSFGYLRRFVERRVMLGGGQVLMGISAAITGVAANFPIFFAGNLLARVGGSPQHPVGSSILSDQFDARRRGLALSAHISGGNFGTVLVPIIGTLVITSLGWRAALFIFAALATVIGLLIALTIDENKTITTEPIVRGQHTTWADIKQILSNRNIQLLFIISTIAAGGRGLGVVITYVPLYLDKVLKIEPTLAGILFTLLLVGSVIGPVIFGRFSDARGRRPILIICYAAATFFTILFTTLGATTWLLPVTLFWMGVTVYAESPLLQTFLADAAQNLNRDLAFGLYFTATFGIGSFWASALGWVIDNFGFVAGFDVMAATYVIAALFVFPTREVRALR